jgi:hypothetical protein
LCHNRTTPSSERERQNKRLERDSKLSPSVRTMLPGGGGCIKSFFDDFNKSTHQYNHQHTHNHQHVCTQFNAATPDTVTNTDTSNHRQSSTSPHQQHRIIYINTSTDPHQDTTSTYHTMSSTYQQHTDSTSHQNNTNNHPHQHLNTVISPDINRYTNRHFGLPILRPLPSTLVPRTGKLCQD